MIDDRLFSTIYLTNADASITSEKSYILSFYFSSLFIYLFFSPFHAMVE